MSTSLFLAVERRPEGYVETVFEKIDRRIEADDAVTNKVAAKVFAYIAYFLTVVVALVDGFIQLGNYITHENKMVNDYSDEVDGNPGHSPATSPTAAAVGATSPVQETAFPRHMVAAAFDAAYPEVQKLVDEGKFVFVARESKFDLENPEAFKVHIIEGSTMVMADHNSLDVDGFKEHREGKTAPWVRVISTSRRKTEMLVPTGNGIFEGKLDPFVNITTLVREYGEKAWTFIRDAFVGHMEFLLKEKSATKITPCTDNVVVDYMHLRFESIS